ncbi:MAG TPA: hypothetical protein VHR72_12655, partial [Gemmataceae bacterium]|nr:hypothetical protein [Gemmataceae bacterium]
DAFYSEPVDWDKELARSRREVRNVSIMGAIAVPLIFGSLIGLDYLDPRPRRYWIEYVLMGLLLLILSTVFGTLLWISHRAAKDSARKEREEKSAFRGGA